jgi:hypothetical protein
LSTRWLTADCVRFSSFAARDTLPSRAVASKATRLAKGISRRPMPLSAEFMPSALWLRSG